MSGRTAADLGRVALRRLALWGWLAVVVVLAPAALSLGLNILLVRYGYLEGIAPWQLLLGFAVIAYLIYGVRDRIPLWETVSRDPEYRVRQLRRHAGQLLRVTKRALRRPWYRRRLAEDTAKELEAAWQTLRETARRPEGSEADLREPLDRLETLFDRHLGFMKISVYLEYGLQIGLAVLAAFVLRESLVEAFKIPSGSMLPTLEVGDHIFVNKLQYGVRFPFSDWIPIRYAVPERGDVVVFGGMDKSGEDMIKRVIGVPGDRVQVEADGTLRLNGRTVRRCPLGRIRAPVKDDPRSPQADFDLFVERLGGAVHSIRQIADPSAGGGRRGTRGSYREAPGSLLLPAVGDLPGRPYPRRGENNPDGSGAFTVPEDAVFVMGDNRDNSNDSRFWGTVPLDRIKGKAMFIWWSNADRSVQTGRIGIWIHDSVQVPREKLTDEQRRCLDDLYRPAPGDP